MTRTGVGGGAPINHYLPVRNWSIVEHTVVAERMPSHSDVISRDFDGGPGKGLVTRGSDILRLRYTITGHAHTLIVSYQYDKIDFHVNWGTKRY